MSKCVLHPGTVSVITLYSKGYCAECKKGIETARKAVDGHVEPKECFIWFVDNRRGWQPIPGTGCAHWVAHEKGIKKSSRCCMAGHPLRVPDVITGKSKVKLENVKVNDYYVNSKKDHIGLVVKVDKPKKEGEPPVIMIKHDSSGQGRVSTNEFATYFKGSGDFYH